MAELWKHGRRWVENCSATNTAPVTTSRITKKGGNSPQNKHGQIGKPPMLRQGIDDEKQQRCRQGPNQRRFRFRQCKRLKKQSNAPYKPASSKTAPLQKRSTGMAKRDLSS